MQEAIQVQKEELVQDRKECFGCHKKYKHLERCKDGNGRCKKCKKRMVTNKFYNPNWKTQNQFVGKFSMSNQEKSILIVDKMSRGMSYYSAKKQIDFDLNQLNRLKRKNYVEEKMSSEERIKQIEQNKRFLEGLGQRIK